jgi:protein-L-isoaspartate(D-aspartate) O-methyltransferase
MLKVYCIGSRDHAANRRLRESFKRGGWQWVRSLRRDQHEVGHDCWLHGEEFCLSTSGLREP